MENVDRLMSDWKISDAKSRFSEVVTKANEEGPQQIFRGGKPAAIVISLRDLAMINPAPMGDIFAPPTDVTHAVIAALKKAKVKRKR